MHLAGRLTPSSTLIVVALEQEARHFTVDHPVLVTGVGKVRAAIAVSRLLASGTLPEQIVNVGTAGGLRPGVEGTHEVCRVVQHDYAGEAVLAVTGRADGPPLDLPVSSGEGLVLATGDRFVAGGSERERVAQVADLVDMEGYAVAAAARAAGVPARLVKHVSDQADEDAGRTWSQGVDACARLLADWVHEHLP
ncbi:nucleosidase [Ornithinimicrobium pratense]|uniref:Nucleoside phosphorylase n=1 Tax=Ornithinimicrobium pratense TaxID=2593973 RepID=A0A5J6V5R5_9MICO|nr:nucleosidase [Ornithinimicrobium pratense]QFG68363.1 nucleoside phosphorylase [Ornithinimicrobium pratense]